MGEQARDEGIDRVLHHTPADYRKAFIKEFSRLLATHNEFTSEDVVETVGQPPNHSNAVGALTNICVRAALRHGTVRVVGWRSAIHKAGHARAIRVYCGTKAAMQDHRHSPATERTAS